MSYSQLPQEPDELELVLSREDIRQMESGPMTEAFFEVIRVEDKYVRHSLNVKGAHARDRLAAAIRQTLDKYRGNLHRMVYASSVVRTHDSMSLILLTPPLGGLYA